MSIKKLKIPFRVDRKCNCGNYIKMLPESHRLMLDDEYFAGLYFECEKCRTTMFMPTKKYPQVASINPRNMI